jgi:hypothetical protein
MERRSIGKDSISKLGVGEHRTETNTNRRRASLDIVNILRFFRRKSPRKRAVRFGVYYYYAPLTRGKSNNNDVDAQISSNAQDEPARLGAAGATTFRP